MNKNNKRQPPAKTHQEMISEWMKDSDFKAAYDHLEDEYQLLREMLNARKKAGLTQAEVAKRMNTYAPAVARLEAITGHQSKHSPRIDTLRKYAQAVGCKLEIHLKRYKKVFIEKHA